MAETLKLSDPKDAVIGSGEIQAHVRRLGVDLAERYAGKEITILTVLEGAAIFAGDLHKYATRAGKGLTIVSDVIRTSSYEGTQTTGEVKISEKPEERPDIENIRGKKVVVVEDIQESRLTIAAACAWLEPFEPESIEVVALLDKPNAERLAPVPEGVNITTGIKIANRFVVGYGLDLDGDYRQLPHITVCDQITHELWAPRYLQEPLAA